MACVPSLGVGLFFADCESGSGASLDAQDASGGFGLSHGVGVWFGAAWGSVAVPAWVSDPVRVVVLARGWRCVRLLAWLQCSGAFMCVLSDGVRWPAVGLGVRCVL